VKSTPLLLCIGQNMLLSVKNFSLKIVRNPSVYKALSDFCVIITRASTLLTMPVAFIFLSPLQICRGGCQHPPVGNQRPVAVPDIFVGFEKPSSSVDRGHCDSPSAAFSGCSLAQRLRALVAQVASSATGSAPIAPLQ